MVVGVLSLALLVLVAKAGHLQLSLGDDLRELAERQYIRKLKVAAPRGNIYDRDGRPLAVSVPAWSVFAAPRDIKDPVTTAERLAPVLGDSVDTLTRRLSSKRAFLWLDRRVAPDTADKVKALGLEGISLKQESRRYYPNRELAGQLLGLVSVDGEGLDGVERAYDEYLRGRTVIVPGLRDNRGRRVVLADGIDLDVLEGDDVYLTIDSRLQHLTEKVLQETVARHDAKSAFAVVMNPKTGAILSLANVPLFNPNSPATTSGSSRRNHALSDGVEPGSIFKMVTFAAALDAGVLTPADKIFCEDGKFAIGKHVIRDAHPAGWLTASEVFSHSSNIGTIKIVQRVGEAQFRRVIDDFGFGKEPGLGLVGEASGRLPNQERWGDVRSATISFGHGLLVTPIQMASAVATIANQGVRVRPRVFEKVMSPVGEIVKTSEAHDGERVISADSARVLAQIMSGVVEDGGTGTLAAIRGIQVAGKTGTAEKVDPVTRRYSRELHLASFVGFAPVDDPQVVAVVMVDEPRGKTVFGGSVAGPAWRSIVEAALVNAGVLTADDVTTAELKAVPASGQQTSSAPGQAVQADTSIEEIRRRAAQVQQGEGKLDLRGRTAREAVLLAEAHGVQLLLRGSGIVVRQDPGPETVVRPGSAMRVDLGEQR